MSTPTVLPVSAVTQLTSAGVAPPRYVAAALSRAALYLSPLLLGLAAAAPLAALPWQLPVAVLATGWCALSVLVPRGRLTTGQAGAAQGAREVLGGFLLVAAAWSVILVLAVRSPAWLPAGLAPVATQPAVAYAVTLTGVALAAVIAVGVATGTEAMVLRWSLPAGLAAVLIASGLVVDLAWLGPELGHLPVELLLPAGMLLPAMRVGLLASGARRRRRRPWHAARPSPPAVAATRLPTGDWRFAACCLLFGAAQVALVVVAWQVSRPAVAAGGIPPSVLPLLLSLPAMEIWLAWHLSQAAAGAASYDHREAHLRHVRRVGWAAIGVLLPPLVAGAALLAAAPRLPYGLSHHPDPPALVHAIATGVLLAGLMAIGALLAARHRPDLAAMVTGAPLLAVPAMVAGPLAVVPDGAMAALPAALAAAYALGLVLAAHVLFDNRARFAAPAG